MDYFQSVAVVQQRFGPAVAGDDVAVEFDGDAIGLHAERFDQGCEGELGARRIREGAGFAIDMKIHRT
jgi:hypothetical protein